MKKYLISLIVTGTVNVEVEAENEDAAFEKVDYESGDIDVGDDDVFDIEEIGGAK